MVIQDLLLGTAVELKMVDHYYEDCVVTQTKYGVLWELELVVVVDYLVDGYYS